MSSALSPLISLATSMHAQPGVYAVLLGSGVSTGAGIPTGWGVITELVKRIAAADDPTGASVTATSADPEAWWREHGEGELGYSTLLEKLAPTPADRQGLLEGFFEPSMEDESGERQPSKAHNAIAQLVKRGSVRVIITTNFDRLTEQALEAVGVSPQVISRPEAVKGMKPLPHARATVIKLHGDYKDLDSRNTPGELDDYPHQWKDLLARVFDEYGLLVSGWSADWDTALVKAMESAPNRRYPLYWDSRSSKGDNATRLLKARDGIVIPADSADDLFSHLADDMDALDRIAHPPLSTAMAVARLKRYLPDPVRRIDLHDLVMGAADDATRPAIGANDDPDVQDVYQGYFRSAEQLVRLVKTGVQHDDAGIHDQLWVDMLQRLVDTGTTAAFASGSPYEKARLFPAFIMLATAGITATPRHREELLIRLATQVEAHVGLHRDLCPAAWILHYGHLASRGDVTSLPRWGGRQPLYPASRLFKTGLREYSTDDLPDDDDDYAAAYHGFEYRLGLLQACVPLSPTVPRRPPISGEYVGEFAWTTEGMPAAEADFRRALERGGVDAWTPVLQQSGKTIDDVLIEHRERLKAYKHY